MVVFYRRIQFSRPPCARHFHVSGGHGNKKALLSSTKTRLFRDERQFSQHSNTAGRYTKASICENQTRQISVAYFPKSKVCGLFFSYHLIYYFLLACSISIRSVWVGALPVQCSRYRCSSPRVAISCISGTTDISLLNLSCENSNEKKNRLIKLRKINNKPTFDSSCKLLSKFRSNKKLREIRKKDARGSRSRVFVS